MTTCTHPLRVTYPNFQICIWCGQWLPLVRIVYPVTTTTGIKPVEQI